METRMLCYFEAKDLLNDKTVYIIEDMTSYDGFIYQNSIDIQETIHAFNISSYNNGYKAYDIYRVDDYISGQTIWDNY